MTLSRKARIFWPLAMVVLLTDCTTKELAVEHQSLPHVPHEVLGSTVQLTLTYNPGLALGIDFGAWSRPLIILFVVGALALLLRLYHRVGRRDRALAAAFGLLCGGGAGELNHIHRGARGGVDLVCIRAGPVR